MSVMVATSFVGLVARRAPRPAQIVCLSRSTASPVPARPARPL